jgi:hypothetical protein
VLVPNSAVTVHRFDGVQARVGPEPPNSQSYDLAILRFDDTGALVDPQELSAIQECIASARGNPNGAVVLLFLHGWHHNADWNRADDTGDEHFRAFRKILSALMLREAERYFGGPHGGGRRVVGIYLGWNGDPARRWLARAPYLTHASFWNRYRFARRIGAGRALRDALRLVVTATKGPLSPGSGAASVNLPESPLVLIGHSMGALMLESAFLTLLKAPDRPLVHEAPVQESVVEVRRDGVRVSFPDVVIALNSAADSSIMHEIRKELAAQRLVKTVQAAGINYSPPLLISATSEADRDTRTVWRLANLPWVGRRTDGHDRTLFTHALTLQQAASRCTARGPVDFNQAWHCVRAPVPERAPNPSIAIDLPLRDRRADELDLPFARYCLSPIGNPQRPEPAWVFQLPKALVANHNDIFNAKARELVLGLIQISGAVMSLAEDWQNTFEPETV